MAGWKLSKFLEVPRSVLCIHETPLPPDRHPFRSVRALSREEFQKSIYIWPTFLRKRQPGLRWELRDLSLSFSRAILNLDLPRNL